jgi:hypothetical protein
MISTVSSSEAFASFGQDKLSVGLLHDAPALMPERHFKESLHVILAVFLTICVIHAILLSLVKRKSRLSLSGGGVGGGDKDASRDSRGEEARAKVHKISYQGTNLIVNLFLGLYGIHTFMTLPNLAATPILSRIAEFDSLAFFALVQIGYNLWSVPVGLLFIQESKLMMVHHISTICVSSICAFCTNGQRYHSPFFFGVIEISSVPLSLMNFSRDNPSWVKNYPIIQHGSRPVFAVLFLVTRVILWTPSIMDVLRNCILIAWTCRTTVCQVASTSFTLSAVFLTALQWYWGFLITKAITKMIFPTKA